MMHEPDSEIEALAPDQRDAWQALIRAAMTVCNASPAAQELAGSGFADALQSGKATMHVQIDLPAGGVTCTAEWSEHLSEPVTLFELVPTPRKHDA